MFFSCRYQFRNAKRVGLQELGPRFTLRPRYLQKGTFDSKNGEYYWIFKVYMSYVVVACDLLLIALCHYYALSCCRMEA